MSRPVALYCRSSRFAWLAVLAGLGTLLSVFLGQNLLLSVLTCTFFAFPMVLLAFLAWQPEVQVYDTHLVIGHRTIPWAEIIKVDHLNWTVPLVVRLTLRQGKHSLILYPGDYADGVALLEQIRRMSPNALLDGIPYDEFWAEMDAAAGEETATQALAAATKDDRLPEHNQSPNNDRSQSDNQSPNKPQAKEVSQANAPSAAPFHLLSPEDEREVELLYQRLKSSGHIDVVETESRDPQE